MKKNKRKTVKNRISAVSIAGILATSAVSVCTASTVNAQTHYDAFQMIDETMEIDIDSEWPEIRDHGPSEEVLIEDGFVQSNGKTSSQFFDWTVNANTTKRSPSISVNSGQSIFISCTLDSENQSVKMGIVDSNNNRRYVIVTKSRSYTFSISKSDDYRVFIENTNASSVKVYGSYNIVE